MKKKFIIPMLVAALCLNGCSAKTNNNNEEKQTDDNSQDDKSIYTSTESNTHAINADGTEESYQNILVEKTGDAEGDEADFYGTNAAVFAQNGATLTISGSEITTDGTHANAVFSYGEGSVINISDTQIDTSQANSGGIMVTGGGTLNATNLTVTTQSGSSAPIRSDRGGGTINVKGGTYKSYGSGSPAIYSTADINVEDAKLYADVAEAVVVEGKNSVTITNSDVTGKNTTHNSDKADVYRTVMIYQSMSGDSEQGKGEFTMTGGSLTSENGGMFFVTNTVADINLENVSMTYASDDLLRIEKAGWGNDGTNGGQVNFTAKNQSLEGEITVDDISVLNIYLENGSSLEGCISSNGEAYVELDADSTWTLTGNSEISGLTCDEDAIILNGYSLTIDGVLYCEGTASSGDPIEIMAPESSGMDQMPPGEGAPGDGNQPGEKPDEMNGNGQAPEKPDGMNTGNQPPEMSDGMDNGEQPPAKMDGAGAPPDKPDNN